MLHVLESVETAEAGKAEPVVPVDWLEIRYSACVFLNSRLYTCIAALSSKCNADAGCEISRIQQFATASAACHRSGIAVVTENFVWRTVWIESFTDGRATLTLLSNAGFSCNPAIGRIGIAPVRWFGSNQRSSALHFVSRFVAGETFVSSLHCFRVVIYFDVKLKNISSLREIILIYWLTGTAKIAACSTDWNTFARRHGGSGESLPFTLAKHLSSYSTKKPPDKFYFHRQ
jgi:hypothetical protein